MAGRTVLSAAALACLASAFPIQKREDSNIDSLVFEFALTLEHLEDVFYKGALQNFTEEEFTEAGYGGTYYNNLKYIAHDEEAHVDLLSSALTALGITPPVACTYNFPYTDVASFITLSSVLEGVGTSAYLGAAGLITSKDYLTVAGSILVAEALHTSYQRAAVQEVPFADPYGTPLDPTSVYTLAAAFITSCPESNKPLPFTPFPSLAVKSDASKAEKRQVIAIGVGVRSGGSDKPQDDHTDESHDEQAPGGSDKPQDDHTDESHDEQAPCAGSEVTLTATNATIPDSAFVTFVSGLSVISVDGHVDGDAISATIPDNVGGQTYVFVTNAKVTKIEDSVIVAGPAILEVAPAPPSIDFSES